MQEQVHEKFKLFRGASTKGEFNSVFEQIEKFANLPNNSAKSIGVEYLESTKELIATLGYTDVAGQGNNVKLEVKLIGNLSENNEALEKKILASANTLKKVICHALFITENHDMNMIFMYDI